MASVQTLSEMQADRRKQLARSLQSGNINFLIGSGASMPAIPVAGHVEQEIYALMENGNVDEARSRMYEFLSAIQVPMNDLISGEANVPLAQTLVGYSNYIRIIEQILSERRTTLLSKQATIFTTNYDLLIEKASIKCPEIKLNDGFTRIPSLDNRMEYSTRNFFDTTYNTGNLYSYKVEIPCINLVKLHGSFSWKKDGEDIIFSVSKRELLNDEPTHDEIIEFISDYAVILPQATKFRTTLMDRTYYELLRIYANELDRENVLLIVFGCSFGDEHIKSITCRALKNPTLRILVFAHSHVDAESFEQIFGKYNNVDIVTPEEGGVIDFDNFNATFRSILPSAGEAL